MDETWADIPEINGAEVSTGGRVRRWATFEGTARPRQHKGTPQGTTVVYRFDGREYDIDTLMRMAFGDEADEMEAGYDPGERDRDLTHHEISEIKLAEGWKPAYEVAEEFRVEAQRIRGVWDGAE